MVGTERQVRGVLILRGNKMDVNTTIIYIALIASGTIICLKIMDLCFQLLVLRLTAGKPPTTNKEG